MNPHEAKHLRTIITIGLCLCLLAILAAYIYFGMKLASAPDVPIEPVVEEPLPPDQAEILQALEAAPIVSNENTEAVVKALEAASSTSETDRQAILEALQ